MSANPHVVPAPAPVIAPDEWREKVMRKCGESVEVKQKFFDHYAEQIGELSQKMAERFQQGRRLWVMGNGGSACDAQHVAVEFIHPIIEKRRALPALDLVSQIPVLTAISNDKDFARVFVDQIELWGQKDDMALAISTSGQSPNLVYALELARARHADHCVLREGWWPDAGRGGLLLYGAEFQHPPHSGVARSPAAHLVGPHPRSSG